jgi:hypothetical protein
MKKLSLKLEELAVESFETALQEQPRGTVPAHCGVVTDLGQETCQETCAESCNPCVETAGGSCEATWCSCLIDTCGEHGTCDGYTGEYQDTCNWYC